MNEVSLVYYGDIKDVGSHLLSIIKVLKVYPATPECSGFFIKEKKFGFESQRKIALDFNDSEAQDFLIYRYLSDEELQQLKFGQNKNKYYIMFHKYLDAEYLKDILTEFDDLHFLIEYSNSQHIQSYHFVRKQWPNHNYIKINTQLDQKEKENRSGQSIQLPVILLFLAKILVNPLNELKRYSILLKYSNLRVLSRALELFIFIDFVIRAVILKTLKISVQQVYYKTVFIMGIFKIVLIKLGYLVRHILLMCGFKSFGIFVDSFNFLVRLKNTLVDFFVYKLWHFIFYKLIHFMYYKIIHFMYYKVFYFIYYRIIYYIVVDLIYLKSIHLYYIIRHIVLMSVYKTYGFCYDMVLLCYRITKLYLLFPLRKSYWFVTYQYNTRIKKYFV